MDINNNNQFIVFPHRNPKSSECRKAGLVPDPYVRQIRTKTRSNTAKIRVTYTHSESKLKTDLILMLYETEFPENISVLSHATKLKAQLTPKARQEFDLQGDTDFVLLNGSGETLIDFTYVTDESVINLIIEEKETGFECRIPGQQNVIALPLHYKRRDIIRFVEELFASDYSLERGRATSLRKFLKGLKKNGFKVVNKGTGKHPLKLVAPGGVYIPIPTHGGGKDLKSGTLMSILKQIGLEFEDLR